jgi:SapC
MADATQQMPLFYTRPMAVTSQRHGDWKVKRNRSYSYAARTHAVPVLAEEMPQLQNFYPLVFGGGDDPGIMALLGLRAGENLFVNEQGEWRTNTMIPAYVARYPFLLVEVPEDKRLLLIMEEDATIVGPGYDVPLFQDGKGTKEGEEILNFCIAFNNSARLTQEFCKTMNDQGLLSEQTADMVTRDGRRLSMSGFKVIDEQKLNAVPDDVFLEWRRRNWLPVIYAHLVSLGRWQTLIDLISEKGDLGQPTAV